MKRSKIICLTSAFIVAGCSQSLEPKDGLSVNSQEQASGFQLSGAPSRRRTSEQQNAAKDPKQVDYPVSNLFCFSPPTLNHAPRLGKTSEKQSGGSYSMTLSTPVELPPEQTDVSELPEEIGDLLRAMGQVYDLTGRVEKKVKYSGQLMFTWSCHLDGWHEESESGSYQEMTNYIIDLGDFLGGPKKLATVIQEIVPIRNDAFGEIVKEMKYLSSFEDRGQNLRFYLDLTASFFGDSGWNYQGESTLNTGTDTFYENSSDSTKYRYLNQKKWSRSKSFNDVRYLISESDIAYRSSVATQFDDHRKFEDYFAPRDWLYPNVQRKERTYEAKVVNYAPSDTLLTRTRGNGLREIEKSEIRSFESWRDQTSTDFCELEMNEVTIGPEAGKSSFKWSARNFFEGKKTYSRSTIKQDEKRILNASYAYENTQDPNAAYPDNSFSVGISATFDASDSRLPVIDWSSEGTDSWIWFEHNYNLVKGKGSPPAKCKSVDNDFGSYPNLKQPL